MNTQCPHCRTVFRIGADTLDAADGRVRCGHCREVFDARARLQTEFAFDQTGALDTGAPRAPGTGGDTAADGPGFGPLAALTGLGLGAWRLVGDGESDNGHGEAE